MNDKTRPHGPGLAAGSPTSSDHPATGSLLLSIASEPVVLADCFTDWLELSDERDRYEQRIIAAEITGYRRGHATGYDRGRLDAIAEHKAVQRDLYRSWRELSELALRRRVRSRPGDYMGGAV